MGRGGAGGIGAILGSEGTGGPAINLMGGTATGGASGL
jgi:hypothetical protein